MRPLSIALAALTTLTACGSSAGDNDGNANSDGGSASDLSTTRSSDLSADSNHNDLANPNPTSLDLATPNPTSPDLAPAPTQAGFVTAWSESYRYGAAATQVITSGSFSASIYEIPPSSGTTTCTPQIFGVCKVFSGCPSVTVTHESDGALQVSGGSESATLTPAGDGTYASFNDAKRAFWSGGETLTFSGAGGYAPAFTTTLTAPSPTVISAPVLTAGALVVPRASDLVFTWGAAGSGDLSIVIGDGTSTAQCIFTRASGSGSMPKAALALMKAGGGSFSIVVQSTRTVTSGNWNITATANTSATDAGGYVVAGTVTFQ